MQIRKHDSALEALFESVHVGVTRHPSEETRGQEPSPAVCQCGSAGIVFSLRHSKTMKIPTATTIQDKIVAAAINVWDHFCKDVHSTTPRDLHSAMKGFLCFLLKQGNGGCNYEHVRELGTFNTIASHLASKASCAVCFPIHC